MNKEIVVGFDVDGTLIDEKNNPIYRNINLLLDFHSRGCCVIVASGGGQSYTESIVNKLGLSDIVECFTKTNLPYMPDIWFDDQDCSIGSVNIRI